VKARVIATLLALGLWFALIAVLVHAVKP